MKTPKPLAALAAGALLLAPALPVQAAAIYGLVIGINDYKHVDKLDGAVNDAMDIASALKQAGAAEVVLLLDKDATREKILASWEQLRTKAAEGDTLFFSFAGHGFQEPEHLKGSEDDGKDETFALAGFDVKGKNSAERILDNDIAEMLKSAEGKNIVFVADSCHSGTMTRGLDFQPRKLKTRFLKVRGIENDPLTKEQKIKAVTEKNGRTDIVSFTAVADHELDPEVYIDDKPRGALSWSVAKALRGDADLNKDGDLATEEIEVFVRENVRMQTEGLQHPQLYRGIRFILPSKDEAAAPPPPPPAASPPASSGALKVFIKSPTPNATPENLANAFKNVAFVSSDTEARFFWDMDKNMILNQMGDVIIFGDQEKQDGTRAFSRIRKGSAAIEGSGIPPYWEKVQKVFDKLELVERLKLRSSARSLAMGLEPGDQLHRVGDKVTVKVQGQEYPYFTLFNLATDGTVNFLYPLQEDGLNDPLEVPKDTPYTLELRVEPPSGGDHFVALFSARPLPELHKELAKLNGRQDAWMIEPMLDKHLGKMDHQMGVHGVFSAP